MWVWPFSRPLPRLQQGLLTSFGVPNSPRPVPPLPPTAPRAHAAGSIPSSQQLVYFFSFLAAGGVFLLLAFMVFLPVIILAPAKFALAFTLGSLCIMAGFLQLRGWRQQLAHMFSSERLPYSLGECRTSGRLPYSMGSCWCRPGAARPARSSPSRSGPRLTHIR
jgi:hypothetical protein